MTPEEFETCFSQFRSSVIRLETLQLYTVAEEAPRIRAFLRGEPRPERSVRTSAWLARIAASTVAGKSWRRARIVDLPLSDYLRYQLLGYVESQACGEQIHIAERTPELAGPQAFGDFWVFDANTPQAMAIEMHYDADGRVLGADRVDDRTQVARLTAAAEQVWSAGAPLNDFLAALPRLERARSA